MRSEQGIRRDLDAVLIAILLDMHRKWSPRAVELIAPRMRRVVDCLRVEIEHIGAGVREGPGDVARETDDHPRPASNRHTSHIQSPWDDEMDFVPDRWKREIQVRVAREQRKAGSRPPRRHRPVVAAQTVRCGGGLEGTRFQRFDSAGVDGGSKWRERRKPRGQEVRVGTRCRDDGLLQRAVQREQHARSRVANERREAESVESGIVGRQRE